MTVETTAEELYRTISEHVADPAVSGWVAEEVMEPITGAGAPVAPPTYASREGTDRDEAKVPLHAVSASAFIPTRSEGSIWHDALIRGQDGRPVRDASVILDAVGSRGGRVEAALWNRREELGGLPAFIVAGRQATAPELKDVKARLADEAKNAVESLELSSWTLPHRHADAWIRYAVDPSTGKTVREGGTGSAPRVSEFNTHTDATDLLRYAPNSALFGFWYSQDSGVRNRQARVYSAETVGYGAQPVTVGATRFDPTPMSKDLKVPGEAGQKDKKPSDAGFGMVPGGQPVTRAYSCELILNRATISLTALRNIRYGDDDGTRAHAGAVLLTVMGMLGHVMASRDQTMLRSGCDLVITEAAYGWRRTRSKDVEPLDLPEDLDVLIELYGLARTAAAEAGLDFCDPVRLEVSDLEVKGMMLSISKGGSEANQ